MLLNGQNGGDESVDSPTSITIGKSIKSNRIAEASYEFNDNYIIVAKNNGTATVPEGFKVTIEAYGGIVSDDDGFEADSTIYLDGGDKGGDQAYATGTSADWFTPFEYDDSDDCWCQTDFLEPGASATFDGNCSGHGNAPAPD